MAPLLFTGSFTNVINLLDSITATIIFCLASSVTYIFNDYKDVDNDRSHPVKSVQRPLASGLVSPKQAIALGVILLIILIASLTFYNSVNLAIVISGYLLLNFCYSTVLKNHAVIDIFCVSSGFVLRVYAGATAISVDVSPWMFITTLAVALFITASKRKGELYLVEERSGISRTVLKNYSVGLIDQFVASSGVLTLVFYCLFVVTSKDSLILTVPFVIFGVFRYWHICEHSNKAESPTEALLTDKQLFVCVVIWTLLSGWIVWTAV